MLRIACLCVERRQLLRPLLGKTVRKSRKSEAAMYESEVSGGEAMHGH